MTIQEIEITEAKVKKLIEVVDAGLSRGMGDPEPGRMCVEAAVCYALGLPHGDNPVCVSGALRKYKIMLNDAAWLNQKTRAKGLRRLAVLQLGTHEAFDEKWFVTQLAIRTVNIILADMMDSIGQSATAHACRNAIDLEGAMAASKFSFGLGSSINNASAKAAYNAASLAHGGINHYGVSYYAAAVVVNCPSDALLMKAANIAEQILIEMNVPGVKWLPLLEEE